MAKPQSKERPYHHGDLRRTIVKAALEILRETQSLEFSLRELARRAGVSHNAPYKHFADKRELLAAVSAAGFEMLTKRMAREVARLDNPREQLFAMLRAYVDHGVENPALYSLMFGGYLSGPNYSRPMIELAEAEKTKSLLARGHCCRRSGTRHPPYCAQRTEDCRRDPGVLVPRARTYFAVGRWACRAEKKVWHTWRNRCARHAGRIGGRIASLTAWHLGRPSSATITLTGNLKHMAEHSAS